MATIDSSTLFDFPTGPDFDHETRFGDDGVKTVAGVDEAGRGPLAGPVVAAAVVLDPDAIPAGLNDSKKLSQSRREFLFKEILSNADVAWASLPASTIDEINIRAASLKAMELAVKGLSGGADVALIDGRDVPQGLAGIGHALVKGDAHSLSIAAASIVAKVIRDRMMINAAGYFPGYGFDRHKGYGSKVHFAAIAEKGPCALHRRSFSPIRQLFEDQ